MARSRRLITSYSATEGRHACKAQRDIKIAVTDILGRHLIAKRNLPAGAILYEAQAHAIGLHEEWSRRVCAFCHKSQGSWDRPLEIVCETCERASYCSNSCREKHEWTSSAGFVPHRWVCGGLACLGSLMEEESLVKARLVLEALAKRYAHGEAGASSEVRLNFIEFRALQHEQCQEADLSEDVDDEAASYFQRWANSMRRALEACEWPDLPHIPNETLFALVSSIDLNCFQCYSPDAKETVMGAACYLGGAVLLNHSCEPNCWADTRTGAFPTLTLRTWRPIKAGEMLTIGYVDGTLPKEERQERLRSQYHFACACSLCVADAAKSRPPWLILKMHIYGSHYLVALAALLGGYYLEALVWIVSYFFVWLKVLGYRI